MYNQHMKSILIVDDNTSLRTLVRDYLSEQGYRALTANNGQNALYTARHEKPDLILLDIMMPEMDGYQFISSYRKESNAPIILLTAKLEENDKVLGLELGADDYLTKPFGMRELLARIRAVLRRAGADAARRCPCLQTERGHRGSASDQCETQG
jgi:DNA-binding response OmpR family regulator